MVDYGTVPFVVCNTRRVVLCSFITCGMQNAKKDSKMCLFLFLFCNFVHKIIKYINT